ncbi:MAG: two component transcriptional regulator, LytTR family [Bacteroidetes bacterium]|jgi:two-component system LytT family response regulator|nr:two component transcriptional regulator, LytTR family [Bacteroidota bacterium]
MTKRTAIIVDDEERSRRVLKSLLSSFFPETEVLGEASNVDEAYELINKKNPQLVFLDIQMPRANGFSLLKKYEVVPFEVIFVTSYDKYAINAIKFSALDYLMKPVEVKDLTEAMDKAGKIIDLKANRNIQMINLLNAVGHEEKLRKIAIHEGDFVKLVDCDHVVSIEADGSYCHIITDQNDRFTLAKYLKDFEDYFGESSNFIRIHKSCLLNLKHIIKYSKGEPCIIEMSNGQNFEVSRRKKQEVLERLKK